MAKFTMTKRNADYVLSRDEGSHQELVLKREDLVEAARSIQTAIHQTLSDNSRDRRQIRKSLTIPVRAIHLHESSDTSELLLEIVDDLLDVHTTYALPLLIAEDLAMRLPGRVSTLAGVKPKR